MFIKGRCLSCLWPSTASKQLNPLHRVCSGQSGISPPESWLPTCRDTVWPVENSQGKRAALSKTVFLSTFSLPF